MVTENIPTPTSIDSCTRRKLRQVLKQGRMSLAIGVIFVSICDLGPNAGYRIASARFVST